MTPAPWWVTLVIGVLTVIGAFFAAQRGAKSNQEATTQREKAAAREEWFRRLQWAAQLSLAGDAPTRTAGLALLDELARSSLATADDLQLLEVLNRNEALLEADQGYAGVLATTEFTGAVDEPDAAPDDEGDEQEGQHVD